MCCRGLPELANPAYLSGFVFSGLLRVAPYCAPGGVRVVSNRLRNYGAEWRLPDRMLLVVIATVRSI
jgi:hypothetical protein